MKYETLTVWSLVVEGGYLMIPIALLLLIAIFIFTERWLVLKRASKNDSDFMKKIRDYITEGDVNNAEQLCRRTDSPSSRLILKGITRLGRPVADILQAIENTGNIEAANMGRGLAWLSTTAAAAPLLGFLGTVIGMIEAFYTLSAAGQAANIPLLSSGIYQALVTTVAGLITGILALFAYNILVARLNRIMTMMEARTMDFMDLLNEPS